MSAKKGPFDIIAQLGSLRRYARSLLRDGQDAEDLVHDALVKAYENKDSFRQSGNLRVWLMSIVHNTYIDHMRKARALDRKHKDAAYLSEQADNTDPDDAIRLRRLREAFMTLPDEQREALHLVAIEGLTYQQAAEALSIPAGTLMSRISRARARLRNLEDKTGETSRHLRLIGGTDNEDG